MKVKTRVTFDIEFTDDGGKTKAIIEFKLPGHPNVPISNTVKKNVIDEIARLCHSLLDRGTFKEDE